MDQYASYLEDICRVGGKKFTSCSQSTRYPVTSFKGELLSVHKIDISTDDPLVHPQYICVLCQRALQRTQGKSIATDSNVSVQIGGCGPLRTWQQHRRTGCLTCSSYEQKAKGGLPAKRKAFTSASSMISKTQPTDDNANASTLITKEQTRIAAVKEEEIEQSATPRYSTEIPLTRNRFVDTNAVVACNICTYIVDGAILTACCEELLCNKCIYSWLSSHSMCLVCTCEMNSASI